MSAQTKSTGPSWPPELYARARPSYPDVVVEKVVKSPSSNEPLNIVELGAGTGIATKVIIEACSGPSAHARLASYTALDASSAMMEALERSLMQAPDGLVPKLKQSGLLGADVTTDTGVATFEDFNSAQRFTGQVDLILIAQAWHWCQDWDKALCNFAKALKPGGTLALLWNLEDKDAGEVQCARLNGAALADPIITPLPSLHVLLSHSLVAAPWVRNAREEFEKYEGDFPQCECHRKEASKERRKTERNKEKKRRE